MALAPYHRARELWRAWLAWRKRRKLAGHKLLRAFAAAYPRAFFIQIGANDGVVDDKLQPFISSGDWSGIMVEPLPSTFERLKRNHAGDLDRLVLENAAIADRDGHVAVYLPVWVEGERIVHHFDNLASLSRDTADRTSRLLVPGDGRSIISTDVQSLSFESLCQKHAVDRVDLLAIDTEGYDYEIVKQIDFQAHRPRLLVYEHLLLSPPNRESCSERVQEAGYETLEEGGDTWCLDASPDDRLTRRWRRLRPGLPVQSLDEP